MTRQDQSKARTDETGGQGRLRRVRISAAVAMRRATLELIASGKAEHAIVAGRVAPSFDLTGRGGRRIRSEILLLQGPAVVTFYCGGWCPYCDVDLRALDKARAAIEERGATLVAISVPNGARSRVARRRLGFPSLVDAGGELAAAFGIRFELPDYLASMYEAAFGTGRAVVSGGSAWTLPLAARYVIAQDGVIAYAEVNADHTRRAEPSDLLPTLDQLLRMRAA
jgi:peroxiredoxin